MPNRPTVRVFRDAEGGMLEVHPLDLMSRTLRIAAIAPSGTTVQFRARPATITALLDALFKATDERTFLVEDVDVSTAACLPFAEGQVGYDSALGHVWLNFDAGHLGEFDPDAAVEVGTLMVAFGRRAQREAAEAVTAVEVSDMASDMAELPEAPATEQGCRALAAGLVRAGYGRRPADG